MFGMEYSFTPHCSIRWILSTIVVIPPYLKYLVFSTVCSAAYYIFKQMRPSGYIYNLHTVFTIHTLQGYKHSMLFWTKQNKRTSQAQGISWVSIHIFLCKLGYCIKNDGWMAIKKNRHARTLQGNQMHILANVLCSKYRKVAYWAHSTYYTL